MKNLILLIVVFGLSVNISKAVDEECLLDLYELTPYCGFDYGSLWQIANGNEERISHVYLDTCGIREESDGIELLPDSLCKFISLNYKVFEKLNRYYSNEYYKISFPAFPFDTSGHDMNNTYYFTVDDIKVEYDHIKSSFNAINSETGEVKFYSSEVISDIFDSHDGELNSFYVSFENVVNAIEMEETIGGFEGIQYCLFESTLSIPASVFKVVNSLSLYPNPATDNITLDLDRNIENIKIISSTGETYYEFSNSEINNINANGQMSMNVYHYPSGVYFVIIDNKYYNKFVIER